jgi:tetratricopeptide (TPR) repeat protein
VTWLDRLEMELDNLRAALEWALEQEPLAALQMMGVLFNFFGRRASTTEGRAWLKAALARSEGETARPFLVARARALAGESGLAFGLGENLAGRAAAEASVTLARQLNEPRILAFALGMAGLASGFLGDVAAARAWGEEAIALCRQHGFLYELGVAVSPLSITAWIAGDVALAHQLLEEGLSIARRLGNPWVTAMNVLNAARIAGMSGDSAEARARFEEAAALFGQMRDRNFYTGSRSDLAHFLRQQGQLGEAAQIYRETLPAWAQIGNRGAVARELECFGFIAITTGQGERAARLLGAAEALRQASNSDMTPPERVEYDRALSQLHAILDQTALAAAWAKGRKLELEQAVACALQAT